MRTFTISITQADGGRITEYDMEVRISATNTYSPFILALQKLEESSRFVRKQKSHMYALRQCLEILSSKIPKDLDIPISQYTKVSFEDLLYSIEQAIEGNESTAKVKGAQWAQLRSLLRLNNHPLGDGTPIHACMQDYPGIYTRGGLLPRRPALQQLSTIDHDNIKDLEEKAINITKKILDDIVLGCKKDIDEYLKICRKQNNFSNYKLEEKTKNYLVARFKKVDVKIYPIRRRPTDVLKAIFICLKEEDAANLPLSGKERKFTFSGAKNLKILKSFEHYRYQTTFNPWFYCQYRLPNCTLTSCFILLLAKTGWNIASVGNLTITDIKKTENGRYEIQCPKHKTGDDTPKLIISKADKLLKICLELLMWNHEQLVKYSVKKESDLNVWFGWQEVNDRPVFFGQVNKLDSFFARHSLPRISLSHIRPIRSSHNFLRHRDIELIRIALGHSSLDTTDLYLKNNLIFRLNEARILEFQKRFENTIAKQTFTDENFKLNGFQDKKVDTSLAIREGDVETEFHKNFSDELKSFLTMIGVNPDGSASLVTLDILRQVFLLKRYYSLRWEEIYKKNPEYFLKHHIHIILYITLYLKISQERKPGLFEIVRKKFLSECGDIYDDQSV